MDALTSATPTVSVSKLIQGISSKHDKPETTKHSEESRAFDEILSSVMQPDQANQVNEEELFAAIIKERISTLKGEDAATQYHTILTQRNTELTAINGYPCAEQAGNEALDVLVFTGVLTTEEATAIRSEAFAAAQLDSNLTALYDSRGSGEDPTIAVASMEEALLKARLMIEKFDSGELEAALFEGPYNTGMPTETKEVVKEEIAESEEPEEEEEAEETPPTEEEKIDSLGTTTPKGNGLFVFNPESRKDGKLAITLPLKLSARAENLVLKNKDGSEIENGTVSNEQATITRNGRKRYRFEKAGKEYPKELIVEVHLKNGKVREYEIKDSSKKLKRLGR